MATVDDIKIALDRFAPIKSKMDFDNVGLLVGEPDARVSKILISLDITGDVIKEANRIRAQLIVSHHPVFFNLRSVVGSEPEGRIIISLIKNDISAICMHTNLDIAAGGVNDALAERLEVKNTRVLNVTGLDENGEAYGIGKIGEIQKEMTAARFAEYVKTKLKCGGLRYYDSGRAVKKVAIGGGACGEYLRKAFSEGCDTFITSDIKHNTFLEAKELGINLLDAGHFSTENVVCEPLAETLRKAFPDIGVYISAVDSEIAIYI